MKYLFHKVSFVVWECPKGGRGKIVGTEQSTGQKRERKYVSDLIGLTFSSKLDV
jgi:hypothetical protein